MKIVETAAEFAASDIGIRSKIGHASTIVVVVLSVVVEDWWWVLTVVVLGSMVAATVESWARQRNRAAMTVFRCFACDIEATSIYPSVVAQFADAHIAEAHAGIAP
jgi:hypothetical protein